MVGRIEQHTAKPLSEEEIEKVCERLNAKPAAALESVEPVAESRIAAALYHQYCANVGGVAFNGDKLPSWDEFFADRNKSKQVTAWLGVAHVVAKLMAGQSLQSIGFDSLGNIQTADVAGVRISLENPALPLTDIGEAIVQMKAGRRVARITWPAGVWIAYSPGAAGLPAERFWAGPNREFAEKNGGKADVLPCITKKDTHGDISMGWVPSTDDLLSQDWYVVPSGI
jgi:hypothetical protein